VVITIDEQKIKKNVSTLMSDHDKIIRSASLNKYYIEKHLVIGYIQKVDVLDELPMKESNYIIN
jgi:hypothetical protein